MASIMPSSMTVWHPDILEVICSYLDTTSIKSLRLVRRNDSEVATPYLFRTLVLGLREHRIARLVGVAENQKFAKSVRNILWDTAHYYDEEPPFDEKLFVRGSGEHCLKLDFSVDPAKRRRQKRHVLNRYAILAAEERAILESDLVGCLSEAFKRMPNFRSLEMTAWMYPLSPEGHVYARYAGR